MNASVASNVESRELRLLMWGFVGLRASGLGFRV